jgi:signal transduction histidine kinase
VSFRLRLTLFGAGVVAIMLVAFGVLVYQLAAHTQGTEQDDALKRRGGEELTALRKAPPTALRPTASLSLVGAEDLRKHTDIFVEVLDRSGQAISSTALIDGTAPAVPADVLVRVTQGGGVLATIATPGGIPLRAYVQPWTRPDLGLSGFMVAGQPLRIQSANLNGLLAFLIISSIPTLLAAFGASWLVTGRALRPLKRVAETADAIGRTRDLKRRLVEGKRQDEITVLSRSFNQMLQQLEGAYQQLAAALEAQRRFVADASHELRTPLTTIRGNAGLLAFGPGVTDEVRAAAERDIATESERMSRLVEHLLTLAQADAGQRLELAPVALQPILDSVCRQAQTAHPDRTFRRDGMSDAKVAGDEDALTELLWILVDNAVKFTKAGGCIEVGLQQQGARAHVVVADDGIGIPPADEERIFERFYQADPSRTRRGAGLGLSIARWIASQHGGTVTARNHDGMPGCTFTVMLPTLSG